MKKIKIFLTLLIVHCTLLIGEATAQWWVQGGNLLWPYGDVTIQNDLNVEGNINGVKKYVALLSQSGTDAPVPTVLENTIGDIVWVRVGAGIYRADLSGAFPIGKTVTSPQYWYYISPPSEEDVVFRFSQDDADRISLSVLIGSTGGAAGDGWINGCAVEIRVYP